jgi:hypothetical protein
MILKNPFLRVFSGRRRRLAASHHLQIILIVRLRGTGGRALGGVVIIGRRALERFVATLTACHFILRNGKLTCVRAMDTHIMNDQVRLRATLIRAIRMGAFVEFHGLEFFRMFRLHVKVQSLFLEETFVTMPAFMGIHAGMFLEMVVHRVLALVGRRAMGTYIESVGILLVSEGDSRSHSVSHSL